MKKCVCVCVCVCVCSVPEKEKYMLLLIIQMNKLGLNGPYIIYYSTVLVLERFFSYCEVQIRPQQKYTYGKLYRTLHQT